MHSLSGGRRDLWNERAIAIKYEESRKFEERFGDAAYEACAMADPLLVSDLLGSMFEKVSVK